jgi:DNA-binding PadR family transcriptional regulator
MSMSLGSRTPFNMDVSPLQVLLLIQLDGGPRYGYEMLKILKEEFEGTWEPKTGTVYPALKSLERKGYVETVEKDGTDFYAITPEGKVLFRDLESHFADSLGFTVKYLSVVFKWMSTDMKQGAVRLMGTLAEKDNALTGQMFAEFYQNLDTEVKVSFLNNIRENTLRRLSLIEKLIQEHGRP